MLCLVLVACWSLAIAEDTYLSPSNNSASKEESSFTSTISIDPWSPVVGDTEGVPAVTQEARLVDSVHGRRAAISLVENIRKQLMRDNYDYVSDDDEELPMIKTPSPDNSIMTTSARRTSIPTSTVRTDSTRATQTKSVAPPIISAVIPHRETRLLPPLKTTPKLSSIQVASVSLPFKSNSGQNFRSFNDSPLLRSLDRESYRPATTMVKDIKREIVISKKDLFFYMDDINLRRNNPHSAISSIAGRHKYDPANTTRIITINGRKQDRLGVQNIHSRNSVKNNHSDGKQSSNYDFNQKNQPNNKLENKTQSHSDDKHESVEFELKNVPVNKYDKHQGNLHDDKDFEQTMNEDDRSRKQQEIEYNHKEKQSQNPLDGDQCNEKQDMKQDNKRNVQPLSEHSHREAKKMRNQPVNVQIHVSQSSNGDYHEVIPKQKPLDVNEEIQQNNHSNREQKRDDDRQNVRIDDRNNFRRSNQRRNHNRKNKPLKRLDYSQYTDSSDDKDTHQKIKQEEQHQINRHSRTPHKNRRKKKVELTHESREQSNEQLNNLNKSEEGGRNVNKNRRKRKRYQPKESVIEENELPEKQIDNHNSLYTQTIDDDKTSHKVIVKRSTLRSTKTAYRHRTQKEIKKNVDADSKQSGSDNLNDNNLSNNLHGDKRHEEPEGAQNDYENQQHKGQKSQYIDSMDNEDFDKFGSRRMNRVTNDKKSAQQVDKQESQCSNGQQGCVRPVYKKHNKQNITPSVQALPSPTAKYKLLKLPAVGGSRRSNVGQRQLIEERGPKGVALIAMDEEPFPQFRLPRSRRQYMDDHADKRPPLMEQISRRSLNRRRLRRRRRKHQN